MQYKRLGAPVVLHGAGHYNREDCPEEIADAIGSWWDDLAG